MITSFNKEGEEGDNSAFNTVIMLEGKQCFSFHSLQSAQAEITTCIAWTDRQLSLAKPSYLSGVKERHALKMRGATGPMSKKKQ